MVVIYRQQCNGPPVLICNSITTTWKTKSKCWNSKWVSLKRRLWSTFQGHCSLNSRAAFNWRGIERNNRNREITRWLRKKGDSRKVVLLCCYIPSWCFCRCIRCMGWFLSLAAQRAAFLHGAVSGGAERGAESRGSQLTSAREIQPGTAVVIGVVSSQHSLMCVLHTLHTGYILLCYSSHGFKSSLQPLNNHVHSGDNKDISTRNINSLVTSHQRDPVDFLGGEK